MVRGTVLRISDAGVLDEHVGDIVIAAAAYGANGESVATRASSPSERDILCTYEY